MNTGERVWWINYFWNSYLKIFAIIESIKQYKNITFLFLLYTIQGIPIGFSNSLPIILQHTLTNSELAFLSLVSLPFSLKIIWAPLVDCFYNRKIGRRKTWLIPIQILVCIVLYYGSRPYSLNSWITFPSDITTELRNSKIISLFIYFFILYVLMATQDIAVDGLALNILENKQRPLASLCNVLGQSFGYVICYVASIIFQDPCNILVCMYCMSKTSITDICNQYFRKVPQNIGILPLNAFIRFCSYYVLFLSVITIYIPENITEYHNESYHITHYSEKKLSFKESYLIVFQLFRIKPLLILSSVLLLCRIPFSTLDGSLLIELIKLDMKKEHISIIPPVLLPLSIITPLMVAKYSNTKSPLKWFMQSWTLRLYLSFIWLILLLVLKVIKLFNLMQGFIYVLLYITCLLLFSIQNVASDVMLFAQMAFFSRVADPWIGGTYMTLLNTVANLGTRVPISLAFGFLDHFNMILPGYALILQSSLLSFLGSLCIKKLQIICFSMEKYPLNQWLLSF